MRNLFSFFAVLMFLNVYGQAKVTVTLTGDPNDPKITKKKQELESKGFAVEISKESEFDRFLKRGDKAFRQQHLNQSLPPFELKALDGNTVKSSDLTGKRVHMNFWSITCKPCIDEFAELSRLRKKYGETDVIYIALAPESTDQVRRVLNRYPLNYITIADAKAYLDQIGVDGYPKNFFVDTEGIIRYVTDGTHYKTNLVGKPVPDNFRFYDEIIKRMQ